MGFNLAEWNKNRDKEEGKDAVTSTASHKEPKVNYGKQIKEAMSFGGGFKSLKNKTLKDLVFKR